MLLRRRPALTAFLLFWAGILLYRHYGVFLWIGLGASLLALLGFRLALLLLFLPLGALYLRGVGLAQGPEHVTKFPQGAFLIRGVQEREAKVLAYLSDQGQEPAQGIARVARLPELRPGEIWWVWAKVLTKPRWKAPGHEPVLFVLSAYRVRAWGGPLGKLRQYLDREIRWLSGDAPLREGLLRALLLGERRGLPEPLLEAFRKTGTIHLLAISGLHVGLIALLFAGILGILRLPRRWVLLGTAGGLAGFAWLVALRPSVLRAVILFLTYVLGELSGRRRDPLNLLGVAGLASLALNPLWAFAPGFHLSYAATFGILYLLPSKVHNRWIQWLGLPFWVSLAAGLFTAPLLAYHFQRIPLTGVPASPVLVLLLFWGMAEGMLALLFHPLLPLLAQLFAFQAQLAMEGILRGVWLLTHLPYAEIPHIQLSTSGLLLSYGCLLALRPVLFKLALLLYRQRSVSARRTVVRGTYP